ncbi:MAG: FHA domain-containing protein [Planctomycetota bacterium]
MARLIVEEGGSRSVTELTSDALFVGSDDHCAVRLRSALSGPKHCQLAKIGAEWHLIDLKSAAGTAVNGEKITEKVLQSGDRIEVPGAVLTFEDVAVASRVAGPGAASVWHGTARAKARKLIAAKTVAAPSATTAAGPLAKRRSSGEKGPRGGIILVLSILGAAGILVVGYMVIKGMGAQMTYSNVVRQARDAMNARDYETARKLLAQVPADIGGQVGGWRDDLAKEVEERAAAEQAVDQQRGSKEAWDAIVQFRQKVESEDDTRGNASVARYFVEYRLNSFLQDFPQSEHAAEVRRLKSIYEALYNPADPYPSKWWDVAMILRYERQQNHFGHPFVVITEWKKQNPGHENLNDAERQLVRLREDSNAYFEWTFENRAKVALQAGNVDKALERLQVVLANVTGIPEVEQRVRKQIAQIEADFRPAKR